MRRIAKLHARSAAITILVIAVLVLSAPVFAKSPAKDRVLIKVNNTGRIAELANKFHLNVKKSVITGTSATALETLSCTNGPSRSTLAML